jgi:hypothetical protein
MKVATPDFIYEHTGKEHIDLADDIADAILKLWDNGIITYSSEGGQSPKVMVHDMYDNTMITHIRQILGDAWTIFQWRISKV